MPVEKVAVIPARAGSKRCPDKNVAKFRGKTLTAHTIEQALEAHIFDRIIVSSDDYRVIEIASGYDVEIEKREEYLATDNSKIIDVIRNLLVKYGFDDDSAIAILQVTAPLRKVEDIRKASEIFFSLDQKKSVVSVTLNQCPVEQLWHIEDDHLKLCLGEGDNISTRKQDYKPAYRWNDSVLFDLAKNFMEPCRNLFGKAPIPYIMPPERSVCIDHEFDLKLVQLIGEHWQ